MSERDIRSVLKDRVQSYGGEIRAVSWLGRRGAPDVLVLFNNGTHEFVETKAPGGVPEPHQAREHARLRAAGCTVRVVSTMSQLEAWLPKLKT